MNKAKIKELEDQVARFQKQIDELKKPEKWQPKDGGWYVAMNGDVYPCCKTRSWAEFGLSYATREQAENASKQMRRFNRLLAYVAEFDDGWVAGWDDYLQCKYYVFYNQAEKKWLCDVVTSCQMQAVYMSRQCAKDLIEKLNSGEVEL